MAAKESNISIMTVLGPIQGGDLGWVLMNEHLACDDTKKRKRVLAAAAASASNNPDSGNIATTSRPEELAKDTATITMENLHSIRRNPWQNPTNLTLSSASMIVQELQPFLDKLRRINHATTTESKRVLATILDVTSLDEGRDHKAVQALAKQLGPEAQVIIGTSCCNYPNHTTSNATKHNAKQEDDLNQKDFKRQIARMERDLLYGIDVDIDSSMDDNKVDNPIRAGFIGQVHLSNRPTNQEWQQLKACAVVQGSTKAPLLVGLPEPTSTTSTCHHQQREVVLDIIQAIETMNGGNLQSKTLLSHMDLYHKDIDLIQTTLDRGYFIGFDRYSIGYGGAFDWDSIYPSLMDVVSLIHKLLAINPSYIHQFVLSAGIEMKLQYQRYGGPGYCIVWELVQRLRQQQQSFSVQSVDMNVMLTKNPRTLLQWWTPPPEPTKPIEYLECSICKTMFEPILGQYYTKFSYTYCGRECLTKHRLNKFKPID